MSRAARRRARTPAAMAAPPASPLSPARLSRLQEKEELRELNDRLAVYIDRVRALELENDRLLLKISEREEVTTREVSGLKALYEAELGDARRLLDDTAKERARLQIELGRLRAEREEAGRSAQKREAELAAAEARGRELDARLQRTEAELAGARADAGRLEAELAGLRGQLSKAEDGLAVARLQLEQETLARVDLENRCQSLREELGFQRSVFEEEVRETRRRQEQRSEGDGGQARGQEVQLARALDELRGQHQEQLRLHHQELERAWQDKLEAARLSAEQRDKAAGAAQEELLEARGRLEALGAQVAGLQKQAAVAEERARELEAQLAAEREAARAGAAARAREAAELRAALERGLVEREELLGAKLALDLEIRAYRQLLEAEERRLKLTPSPSPRASRPSSTASVGRPGRGKRKRPVPEESPPGQASASGSSGLGSASSSGSSASVRLGPPVGGVAISEVDAQGRFVRLRNVGAEDQALGGWRLRRRRSDGGELAYRFSPKFVLRSGQAVTVWAAGAGATHSPPDNLVWRGQSSWGPARGAHTVLLSAGGEEVASAVLEAENGEQTDGDGDGEDGAELGEDGAELGEDGAELGEEDLFLQQGDPRTTSRGCRLM